ncbi:Desiccation-related protein PCC13-62 [Rhynchospora pubera]|uniref:Desiccation-related protein PCC13-62 n=1 Tax=Rhynchospora pubera TaxID=906938 RepID=A0AAV8D9B7_9POAL|nr:Desiccation-related protein PCC13-62 [Rhynchospora pubera]
MDPTIYYSLKLTIFMLLSVLSTISSKPLVNNTYPKNSNYPPLPITCPVKVSEIPLIRYLIPYDDDSPRCTPMPPHINVPVFPYDRPPFHFALNLEFIEAEWFLHGALGIGLDEIAPELAHGGPPPIDGRKANLDEVTKRIITEFAYQEVSHIRYIEAVFGPIQRPLIDISRAHWAKLMNMALGYKLDPPFDPFIDSLHYMVASYVLPYIGLNGYTGANPNLDGYRSKRALAGLLSVESAQDAILRGWLFERLEEIVEPYNITVAVFTDKISQLRNRLAMCGIKDEGLIVPPELGAEMRICTNVISANVDSISYSRTPKEILRIVYETGDEHIPGGFLPEGGNGEIARMYLELYQPQPAEHSDFNYPGYDYEEYPYLEPPSYYGKFHYEGVPSYNKSPYKMPPKNKENPNEKPLSYGATPVNRKP